MSTQNLIPAINRLAREAHTVENAIELLQPLLADEFGAAALQVVSAGNGITDSTRKTITGFLESHDFPFRGIYTAPIVERGAKVGWLIAGFKSSVDHGGVLPTITNHLASQLSEIRNTTRKTVAPVLVTRPAPAAYALRYAEAA
jgi:hypothetical protein